MSQRPLNILPILNDLPNGIADILKEYTLNNSVHFLPEKIVTKCLQVSGLELSEFGLALLPIATSFATAPVSQFNVGAVAFDSIGNAYLGANFEFSGTHIGQTIHAEQSAIANAWQHGAQDLSLLVINYAPCGHCRQFINEVNITRDFLIQLPDSKPQPLSYYLPDAFGPSDLGIGQRILGGDSKASSEKKDAINMAKNAQVHSHSPYSNSQCGISVTFEDDEIVTGRYAENAAFNPSLPALQVALNTRRLQGKDWKTIKRCVMFESSSTLQQRDNAMALLKTFSDCELEHHIIDIAKSQHQH
ncbi:MAG: cytidine deaminase [Gammaproteobacteria bacterium]|nr:cytidine deaminase [Gammaproteobacteria bacterium]